jgi:hypothetical protein
VKAVDQLSLQNRAVRTAAAGARSHRAYTVVGCDLGSFDKSLDQIVLQPDSLAHEQQHVKSESGACS